MATIQRLFGRLATVSVPISLSLRYVSADAPLNPQTELKRQAGYEAIDQHIKSGMTVGLGTGSTSYFAVERLGQKIQAGELANIKAIPTSKETEKHALSWNIPIIPLEQCSEIDVAVDGADEVDPQLNLVKGRGGALLREKMIEEFSRKFVVIVDESKLVSHLGHSGPVPIEVVPFAWEFTMSKILTLPGVEGCRAKRRMNSDGTPYITDNGNYIIDLLLEEGSTTKPEQVCEKILNVVGVVEHGVFINIADEVIVASKDGIRTISREDFELGGVSF